MAGHQLKKLAQSRGKGVRSSLIDVVPRYWSVYTLLFSTVFLLLFCFLLFDIRTSPTALLLQATNQLGALRAQAGEFYSQSSGNNPADLVRNSNFRKGMHYLAEEADDDSDAEDNQKRKPKSFVKGMRELSNPISRDNELEGNTPSTELVHVKGSNSDGQELSADSETFVDDVDLKPRKKVLQGPRKGNPNEADADVDDQVIDESLLDEEVQEQPAVEEASTDKERTGEVEVGKESTEEDTFDVAKLKDNEVDKESSQEMLGQVVRVDDGEESTQEAPENVAKPDEGEGSSKLSGVSDGKDGRKTNAAKKSEEEDEVSTKSSDKKVGDLENLNYEEVFDTKKEHEKTDMESKPRKHSKETAPQTSGIGILKEVTSDRKCDYSVGQWVYDESYPLYKPDSCPFVDGGFRCVENGRPNAEFQKYRWQPSGCNLPRFDPKNMLEKLRGRRLAFVGDSIGRNNWESLLCMLAEAVSNKSRIYEINGESITKHKGFLSFRFEDYDCTVEYYRSPYLVPQGRAPPDSPFEVHSTFKLDLIDWSAQYWTDADILIFNSGHWWSYEKTVRGGNYFQVKDKVRMEMEVGDAFRMAMQTVARYVEENVDPQKTQVFWRSYAPVHFRGGTWKTGGNCNHEQRPLFNLTNYEEPWVNQMISGVTQKNHRTPMTFLNVTYASEHRADGHSSIWQRVPPSPMNHQDCSHWCLPGVPDTWNEFLYASLLDRGQGPWGDKTA